MADNNTEQKSLPASEKKLRDARRKGQVSSSRDLISGFGLLAMLAYLYLTWPMIRDRVMSLLDLVSRSTTEPFNTTSGLVLGNAIDIFWIVIAPALATLILVTVIVGMAGTRGPVFSFESVKPNFEHINPAAGLKRLFSVRNVIEFAKSFVKVVVLAAVLFLVLRYWLQEMFSAPRCGEACIVPLLLESLRPVLAVAAFAFIVIGFTDVGIQQWLFGRDMLMTRTESKRERKDIEGDPLIRGERRRERQRQHRSPRLGLASANVIIAGADHIAGLRYSRKDMPVPVVVIRSSGKAAAAIRQAAEENNIPITENAELASELVSQHRPGDYVHQRYFPVIARILIEQRLV